MQVLMAENPGFSKAAIQAILHKAHGRGLLTKSESGRAGGQLTKKAIDLLTNHNQTITSSHRIQRGWLVGAWWWCKPGRPFSSRIPND